MRTSIKICGIGSIEEATRAIEAGADALGFNCVTPPGPRTIPDDAAARIVYKLSSPVESFLLTSEVTASAIARQLQHTNATAVQILHPIDPSEAESLASLVPDVMRVQVLHVQNQGVLEMYEVYRPFSSAFLLDSGSPHKTLPEYGGTGCTHDWSISEEFVKASDIPVFLAGGLTSTNVIDAIQKVKPEGVDVSTGVRTQGRLDKQKLSEFCKAVRETDLSH